MCTAGLSPFIALAPLLFIIPFTLVGLSSLTIFDYDFGLTNACIMARQSYTYYGYSAAFLSRALALAQRASLKLIMRSLGGGNGNARKFCMSSDTALLCNTLLQPVLHEFLSPIQAAQTWRIAYEGRIVTILHCPFRAPDTTGRLTHEFPLASLRLPSSQLQTGLPLWPLLNILP